MVSRRDWIRLSLMGAAGVLVTGTNRLHAAAPAGPAVPIKINVFKTAACGCCKLWVTHLEKNGFVVTSHDVSGLDEMNGLLRIPLALQGCHAGVTGPYAIAGHVPADLIQRLVAEKPARIIGLAVPGMPRGSPGMEGGAKEAYSVISFEATGTTHVYAKR